MADPWSDDLAALGEHTRHQLRSLDATRTALSRSQETKMRLFKTHPALAAILAVLVLALFGGAAYAVVREVFITIDPDKPADQIQQDINDQLQRAGVPATAQAEKDGDRLKVRIRSTDPNADEVKINVAGRGDPGEQHGLRLRLEVHCELTDAQREALQAAASSERVIDLVVDRGDNTDADVAAAVKQILADAGFTDTDVAVTSGELAITIKSPPK